MRPSFRTALFFTCAFFVLWSAPTASAQIERIHLLLISNGHYIDTPTNNNQSASETIIDFSGAHVSAMVVNSLLDKHFGLTSSTWLRSDENRIVSKDDVFAALNSLKQKIGVEQNEYVVVYYVGHGFGEGIAWNYFLQPGNVAFPKILNSFDVEALAQQLIYVGDLNAKLLELSIPYTLLIDACYEGEVADFATPLLSETAQNNLKDVSAVLKFINQFRGNNPVVFAAQPGKTVSTVDHPLDPSLPYNIGPLARRLVLSARQWSTQDSVSLEQVINSLQSSQLDARTQAAVSFADFDPSYAFPKTQRGTRVTVDRVWGSATTADLLPLQEALLHDDASAPISSEKSIEIAFATIAVLGKPGEYISDGKDYVFTTGSEEISIETLTDSELVLQMTLDGESWTFSIAAPEGERLAAKHYKDVGRYLLHEAAQAGLEVSGAGRGCNEISGDFEIESISYIDGIPNSLSLSYRQFCDDEPNPIEGIVMFETKKL